MRMFSRVWAVVLVTVSVAMAGCERGLSPAEQNALGAEVWGVRCGFCHTEGGLGTRITPPALASYRSVGNLVDYTRRAMPYGLGGTMTDDEYRAVVAFLLHEQGLLPDSMPVDAATADIRLEPPPE